MRQQANFRQAGLVLIICLSLMSYLCACDSDETEVSDQYTLVQPLQVDRVGEWGFVLFYEVSVDPHYAYCITGESNQELLIVKRDDITEMEVVSTLQGFSRVTALTVSGSYLYLAEQEQVTVIDVSIPEQPHLVT